MLALFVTRNMTISLSVKSGAPCLRSSSTISEAQKRSGWRSRGWTPLKYPKSAFSSIECKSEGSLSYFPLHRDVLIAAVRELCILDGRLDPLTLKITEKVQEKEKERIHCATNNHAENETCRDSLLLEEENRMKNGTVNQKKRKKAQHQPRKKAKLSLSKSTLRGLQDDGMVKSNGGGSESEIEILDALDEIGCSRPSSEDFIVSLLRQSRSLSIPETSFGNIAVPSQTLERTPRAPRKVSEADQSVTIPGSSPQNDIDAPPLDEEADEVLHGSQEISAVLDFTKKNPDGSFVTRQNLENVTDMLYVSISNEALLRDATMRMTKKLIPNLDVNSLRLFFGYKTPAVSIDRLTTLLAGYLFDTSHAMFAWFQTESEILANNPTTSDLDSRVQESLFDRRALIKIGGFDSSSILPHAISIARLRRRNCSWESFASTVQGKRMLEHHGKEKAIISAGKKRRGQRLRQRHWLTSALLWQENEESSAVILPRSRSGSISSETDDDNTVARFPQEGKQSQDFTRQNRILAEMRGSRAVTLVKQPPTSSWGVCLVEEGSACVVGRAEAHSEGSSEDSYLQCGDMILYANNERGEEACSPLCMWSGAESSSGDWFRRVVDLFKTSEELRLVIQRV